MLSLNKDSIRKEHIRRHFLDVGIDKYEFCKALEPTSPEVIAAYNLGLVKGFPDCFRCGAQTCECANNILIPNQVANFLSFKQIWESIRHTKQEWTLICEDDVLFFNGGVSLLERYLEDFGEKPSPFLIRLSASGITPNSNLSNVKKLTESNSVFMSNPAYILNGYMANELCNRFRGVNTTSDIWLHQTVAQSEGVGSHTVHPLLATELSYNPEFAIFTSGIHPKGITEQDKLNEKKHIKRVASEAEYQGLLMTWKQYPSPKQWNYLSSGPFQMCYMLAAGVLRNFKNILEIGSYRTPLYKYINDDSIKIVALDPMIPDAIQNSNQFSEMLDYRASLMTPFEGEPYALLILGLDLPVVPKLKKMIANAEIAVLEYPEDAQWKRSRETYDELKETVPFNELMNVSFGLDDNDFSMFGHANEWPPRTQRFIKVISAKYDKLSDLNSTNPCIEPLPIMDTSKSKLVDTSFLESAIFPEADYEFSHAANAGINYLGGGILYYSICHMFRSNICVCLGTGGAFVPRLMRQAQRDLGVADSARTIVVDGDMGVYGRPNWMKEHSFFKQHYSDVEIIVCPTADAAKAFSEQGVSINYLHIDADHSYEGALQDFNDYLPLMAKGAVVTLHDTKLGSHPSVTCGKALKDIREMGYDVVDFNQLGSGVAIIKIP